MRFVVLITLASLVLAGCLPTVVRNSASGATGEFVKGQVIGGFPNLPLYPKAQVLETYGSKEGYGGSFVTQDALAKVVNFYSPALSQLGWEILLRQKSQTNYVYEIKNNTYTGEVIINTAADGKQTAITVASEPR